MQIQFHLDLNLVDITILKISFIGSFEVGAQMIEVTSDLLVRSVFLPHRNTAFPREGFADIISHKSYRDARHLNGRFQPTN